MSKRRYHFKARKKSLKTKDPYPLLRKQLSDAGDSAFISRSIYEEIAMLGGVAALKKKKISEEQLGHFFKKLEFYLSPILAKNIPEIKDLFVSRSELVMLERKFEKHAKDLLSILSDRHFHRLYFDRSSCAESLDESLITFESRCAKIRKACNATNYDAAVQCALTDLLFMVNSTNKFEVETGERSYEIKKATRTERNRAVLYAGTQTKTLLLNRFPTFLVDVFGSSIVMEMFPGQKRLKVSGVESMLKKVHKKGLVKV